MYVRTKQIPPDEGNWYRYLVRAERKNDQVQQKVVKYLGKATGPDDHSIHEDDDLDDLPDDIEDKLGTTGAELGATEGSEEKWLDGVSPDDIDGDVPEMFRDKEARIEVGNDEVKTHTGAKEYNNILIDEDGIRTAYPGEDEETYTRSRKLRERMKADDNRIILEKTVVVSEGNGNREKFVAVDSEFDHKDDIKDLDYDKTKRKWTGNTWVVKANDESVENTIEGLRDKGYTVGVKQSVTEDYLMEE